MPRQNLKQATKKSQYQAKVTQAAQLGTSKSKYEFSDMLNEMEKICGEFIKRVVGNLQSEDMIVTGKIADISLQATEDGINITAHPYLVYQSRGVSGVEHKYDTPHSYTDKMPPVGVFIDWIKEKNIQLSDEESYAGKPSPFKGLDDEKKIESDAWAMAMSVYKNGIAPRDVYEKEIPQLIDELTEYISDFAVQYILQDMDLHPVEGGGKRIILPK